jgi:hypothetical protein
MGLANKEVHDPQAIIGVSIEHDYQRLKDSFRIDWSDWEESGHQDAPATGAPN